MASDRYVVVLDAGTSRMRCFVFDLHGRIVASRSADWTLTAAPDASPLAREFDLDSLWPRLCRLTMSSLADAGGSPGQVVAVTATGQRQGVVFLDAAGRELYAGPNLDLRAVFEGAAIDEEMRERVYRTTGHTPSLLFTPAKLRWFQSHRPNAYDAVASVLTLADWLVWRLSGALASEHTLAAEAGLLNISERRWCTDIMKDLGLVENGHVPLAEPGTVAGAVGDEASGESGIPKGTPVVVSGADTQCGLLGMGVRRPGEVGIVAGWSTPIQMVTAGPLFSDSYRTWAGCYLLDQTWTAESSAGDAGNSYRWLVETLGGSAGNAFEQMDELAKETAAGAEGTLAFLGTSRMDMRKVGLKTGGIYFPVPMTFNEISPGHLARAALEAMAYSIASNLEQVEDLAGEKAAGVALGGGMIQTSAFTKILCDVLGRPVQVSPAPHVSALGAYLCAATGIGEFASLDEAAESVRGSLDTADPDPQTHLEYLDHYDRWTKTLGQIEEVDL